ncbi:hypothetical protein [Methyloversatilis discipulorum]|jgi:hypothetical protein|uniref:hypothetical protein n=1 Tax=Methyloversatilis discipulorum TaxID=1119528 RepID=UPI001A568566|nr:hypothetical protein [Methyloversatilis discipulorum]MBL8468522.1 hypothetical protein [Methyloversatilis discipulorum]
MSSIRHSRWMWRAVLLALCAVLLHAGAGSTSAFHKARLLALGLNDLASVCLNSGGDGPLQSSSADGHCALCLLSGASPLPVALLAHVTGGLPHIAATMAPSPAPSLAELHRADLARAPPARS